MRALLIAALFSIFESHAGCKELASAVEGAHKEIASLEAFAARAPDPALRLKQANHLAAINANLLLMDRAKCPMPQDPITADGSAYSIAAGRCAAPGGGEDTCRRDSWKRNGP